MPSSSSSKLTIRTSNACTATAAATLSHRSSSKSNDSNKNVRPTHTTATTTRHATSSSRDKEKFNDDINQHIRNNGGKPIIASLDDRSIYVPKFLRDKFLIRGYRVNYSTVVNAFASLFQLHNETVNIWSALGPLILFAVMAVEILRMPQLASGEKTVFLVYSLGAMASFGTSTIYHWFGCMSRRVNINLVRMDIAAIALLIGGSYYPAMYYAFYCHPFYMNLYLGVISVLCLACVFVFMVPKFTSDEFQVFRVIIFGSATAFGFVPMMHLIALYGLQNEYINRHINLMLWMYGLYGLGVVFYVSRIPERVKRRTFDLCGHSHNLWHIMVFAASLVHFINCQGMIPQHAESKCFGMEEEFMHSRLLATNTTLMAV